MLLGKNAVPSCADRIRDEDDRQDCRHLVLCLQQTSDVIGCPFWALALADTISAIGTTSSSVKTARHGTALLVSYWIITKADGSQYASGDYCYYDWRQGGMSPMKSRLRYRQTSKNIHTKSHSCKYVDSNEANNRNDLVFLVVYIEDAALFNEPPQEGGKEEAEGLVARQW